MFLVPGYELSDVFGANCQVFDEMFEPNFSFRELSFGDRLGTVVL